MANVIFEEGTQTQASGFQAGDTLLFKVAAPTDVVVAFTPAAGLSAAATTLTVGEQSLTFSADALGDAGTDIVFFAANGELLIGGTGADVLPLTGADASASWGLAGVDTIAIAGAGAHVAHGGDGADSFSATGAGTFTIFGDAGDDVMTANTGTGAQVISGGLGADTLIGGDAADHLYGNVVAPTGTVVDGADSITAGLGNDYVNGNAGADTIDGGAGSDRLNGGADADVITGAAGNDSINGNKGADTIDGGADNDNVRGGADNDSVSGGAGNDVVRGDLGDDTVVGGAGADLLTGDAGADVFTFVTTDAAEVTISSVNYYDTITDFSNGEDKIDFAAVPTAVLYVTGATYAGTTAGFTAAKAAAQTVLTAGADTDLVSVVVGSDTFLFYDADGTGGVIDSYIKLAGITDASLITTADFV